jgi:prephenate dehydrogenase
MVGRLAVVGTGLIGASVGLAAKRAGIGHVVGFDPDAEVAEAAAAKGAIDEVAASLGEAVAGADLAVVAAPVTVLPLLVEETLARAPERCTITDVGSTKDWSLRLPGRFVGGHPVCGREARGPAHATADLFDGATWFLTPVTGTEPDRYRLVHGFVVSLGAVPVAIDPRAHDRVVALTSHLPHALANLLVNHAGAGKIEGHDPLLAAGGSLRDMTRVAGANPRIWVDIFLDNGPELVEALGEHRRRVEQLQEWLAERDAGSLARWIAEASENRRRMLAEAYPDPGALQQVTVHVPDRPGVLAGITQALGAERINIEDFELRHFSPDRGGVLTVLVSGEGEAERAAALLEAQGYGVSVSPVLAS